MSIRCPVPRQRKKKRKAVINPLHELTVQLQSTPDFLDFTDSRFHQNGFLPPREAFQRTFSEYLDQRSYAPDSKGYKPARDSLTQLYRSWGFSCGPEDFLFTAGTSEAYSLLFSTLAEPGDGVLLPRPGYPLFEQLAAQSRLKPHFYDQRFSLDWQIDPKTLVRTPGLKFLVLISPNNPTGQILSSASVQAAADFCIQNDVILICDEVFDLFLYGNQNLPRPGALFPGVKTITLNGISKRFASPDFKLSWTLVNGPSHWKEATMEKLELINDAYLSANSYSQFLLPVLMKELEDFQRMMVEKLEQNRQVLIQWLKNRPALSCRIPQAGIHGLLKIPDSALLDDEEFCLEILKEEHLAVHPGYYYDVQEKGTWVVFSLLKTREGFEDSLLRIDRFLEKFSG